MPPLHALDYLVLIVIVYSGVEVILEGRKRRWWRAAVALVFCSLFIWYAMPIFRILYKWINKTP